jgi:hypothetical protein
MDELLQAAGILAGLYATKARKVPDGAPASFVPARWAGYLEKARPFMARSNVLDRHRDEIEAEARMVAGE